MNIEIKLITITIAMTIVYTIVGIRSKKHRKNCIKMMIAGCIIPILVLISIIIEKYF